MTRFCITRWHKGVLFIKVILWLKFVKLTSTLLSFGLSRHISDASLSTLRKNSSFLALVYIDDIILAGNDMSLIINVKEFLNTTCCIKDLGPFRYFLGLEVTTSTQGIAICQRKYWLQLSSCTISKVETIINSYPLSDTSPCRRLLGELLYLTPTKPNICFAVLGGTL